MILAGVAFALTKNPLILMAIAIIGVFSPSGNEIGPFLSIEQAGLTQLVPNAKRTKTFAWYNLSGSFATAAGALTGGLLAQALQLRGVSELASYRSILMGYSLGGLILVCLFLFLSPAIEVQKKPNAYEGKRTLGLYRSRNVVLKLSMLFAMDAFAGGLIVQSLMVLWFVTRFKVDTAMIGSIFFAANILAGISALLASRIARRFGLINTMVFTHIPSNIMLMLVPLMPSLPLAIGLLLLRFSISQMDVPTRQSYTMAVVEPDERSAASGVTTIARSIGAAISPSLTGIFLGIPALLGFPFILSGGIKIIYDLLLYRNFKSVKPPEEK